MKSELEISRLRLSTHRAIDGAKVGELAKSITNLGGQLLHPIVVDEDGNVLAGAHRVEAFRRLSRKTIPATVVTLKGLHAELAQLDENLCRNDGTALERSKALARQKEIYELLHPSAKKGGDRRSDKAKSNRQNGGLKEQRSFAKSASAKTGDSERSVQRYVEVGEKLAPEAADIIRETASADRISELEDLAKLDPKAQIRVAKKVAESGQPVRKIVKKEEGDEINERFTPRAFIEELCFEFHFDLDVASHQKSPAAKLIKHFWTKKDDGLRRSWKGKRVWCNPPFDDLEAWVAKAHHEVRAKDRCPLVVMLMPAVRTEQPFWQQYIEPYRDQSGRDGARVTTRFVAGRPRFGHPGDPEGARSGSPEFGCVLVVWEAFRT